MNLSRLESESTQLSSQTIDLNHMLQTLGENYASQAEQSDISFSLQLPPYQATTLGNDSQLLRAFSTLLDNALKFTLSGGSIRVDLATTPDGTYYEISIEDTGIGVSDDELDQLLIVFIERVTQRAMQATAWGWLLLK